MPSFVRLIERDNIRVHGIWVVLLGERLVSCPDLFRVEAPIIRDLKQFVRIELFIT